MGPAAHVGQERIGLVDLDFDAGRHHEIRGKVSFVIGGCRWQRCLALFGVALRFEKLLQLGSRHFHVADLHFVAGCIRVGVKTRFRRMLVAGHIDLSAIGAGPHRGVSALIGRRQCFEGIPADRSWPGAWRRVGLLGVSLKRRRYVAGIVVRGLMKWAGRCRAAVAGSVIGSCPRVLEFWPSVSMDDLFALSEKWLSAMRPVHRHVDANQRHRPKT
jgi:hypothetical protein